MYSHCANSQRPFVPQQQGGMRSPSHNHNPQFVQPAAPFNNYTGQQHPHHQQQRPTNQLQQTYQQPHQQQQPHGIDQYGFMMGPPPPDFQYQLFGCFEDSNVCCEAYLCGYCQVASQHNMVENSIADIDWAVCAGMACLDLCCGCSGLALCVGTIIVRGKIRKRYNIYPEGREFEDCCSVTWCMCCAIAQQHREMTGLGQYPGGTLTSPPPPLAVAPQQQVQIGVLVCR